MRYVRREPMESVFQYKLPVWHPQAVHFPVALLLTAAVVAIIWSLQDREAWRTMLLLLLGLGTASGLIAYQTGERLLEHVEGTPIVELLVDAHAQSAYYTLLISGASFVILTLYTLARSRFRPRTAGDPLVVRLIVLIAVLSAASFVAWTAHIGGTMVWGISR